MSLPAIFCPQTASALKVGKSIQSDKCGVLLWEVRRKGGTLNSSHTAYTPCVYTHTSTHPPTPPLIADSVLSLLELFHFFIANHM